MQPGYGEYVRHMHWELWDTESGNLVGHRDSEADALSLVRELAQLGWPVSLLTLLAEDKSKPVHQLPPAMTGDELERRAAIAPVNPNHQTLASGRHVFEEGYRFFYRIVKSNPPDLFDMQSAQVRGYAEPPDPERRAVWDGLSVFSTLSQARRKQRTSPGIGRFIATLRIPTDGSVRFERTLRDAGHHTIWADAALLLKWVVFVEPA
jgi:hypothetical protein